MNDLLGPDFMAWLRTREGVLTVGYFISLVLAFIYYNQEQIKNEDNRLKRTKYLLIIGEELFSGVQKCIENMRLAESKRFSQYVYRQIDTSSGDRIRQDYFSLDTSEDRKVSRAIRQCYESLNMINRGMHHENKKKRGELVGGWSMTEYKRLIIGYNTICEEYNKIRIQNKRGLSLDRFLDLDIKAVLQKVSDESIPEYDQLKERLDKIWKEIESTDPHGYEDLPQSGTTITFFNPPPKM